MNGGRDLQESVVPAAARSGKALHPLLLRLRLEDEIVTARVAHAGRGLLGIKMARKQQRVVGHLGQALIQAEVQIARVASGQVRATATVQEQRVAGDQAVLDQKALAAGS